jgi:hypothetical protein
MAKANGRAVAVSAPPAALPRREYWRAVVEACRRSGLRQVEFCRRRGIPPGTLSFWKHTLSREGGPVARPAASVAARRAAVPAFMPVRIASPRPLGVEATNGSSTAWAGEIEIAMGSGRLVRVRGRVDAACLRQVIRTLGSIRC